MVPESVYVCVAQFPCGQRNTGVFVCFLANPLVSNDLSAFGKKSANKFNSKAPSQIELKNCNYENLKIFSKYNRHWPSDIVPVSARYTKSFSCTDVTRTEI